MSLTDTDLDELEVYYRAAGGTPVVALIAELRASRKVVEAMRLIKQIDIDRDYGSVGMGYEVAWEALEEFDRTINVIREEEK